MTNQRIVNAASCFLIGDLDVADFNVPNAVQEAIFDLPPEDAFAHLKNIADGIDALESSSAIRLASSISEASWEMYARLLPDIRSALSAAIDDLKHKYPDVT
ncbi:MAG: hypothetical protein WAW63_02480 [Candidatus Saccharimonadales bacterium]|nr:hypothetical protein [Candidatus Saccharibacteria bacterium]